MSKTTEYVLWGFNPAYAGGEPIKITGGTFRACEREFKSRYDEGGWKMRIYPAGVPPTELRELATAAKQ